MESKRIAAIGIPAELYIRAQNRFCFIFFIAALLNLIALATSIMSSFISIIPPVSLAIFEPLPIVEGQDINKAKALFKTLHSIVGKYAGSGSSIDKDSLVKQVRCYILDKKHRNKKQEGFNLQTLIVVFIRMYWYTIESSKISQWFLLLLAAVKKYPKSVWTTDNTRRSCSSTLFTQL